MQSLAGTRLSPTTIPPRAAQHAFQGNLSASPTSCLNYMCL